MAAKNIGATPTSIGLNRYVHVGFFAAWLVLAYVLIEIMGSLWGLFWASNDFVVIGIAVVIASVVTVYAYGHPRINTLAKEVATELSKVTWPTRKETSAFTITVIVTSVIAAVILGTFDMFWSYLTELVY